MSIEAPARHLVLLVAAIVLVFSRPAIACEGLVSACATPSDDGLALIAAGKPVAVIVEDGAERAVAIAADNFAADLGRVSGTAARRGSRIAGSGTEIVLAGVIGASPAIDALVRAGKLNLDRTRGEWEGFTQAVVENPWPGVERALVIAGADRRGTIFGLYDLSEKIGVSPWYWWADVPVAHSPDLWITAGARSDHPTVKYRGFFINDEDPAFKSWAEQRFGGVNAKTYAQVFELLLRLKGNYLWPAMWGKSIAEDDPASLKLAADTGVVLGTSHHEPLTRAHVEWERAKENGAVSGEWNYATNAPVLREFWNRGMERFVASGAEGVVTVGMRGDGDEAMSEDTAIPLLESIVRDQRRIIADTTNRPAETTPQLWALYKEVQDYYDKGMQVPDDVTLLFSDDNWGQIRRLPPGGEPTRKGGYGVYYHFDYVGGPRNYKWLDTVQIEKTWQQMNLAWQRGARTIWIVNVGDIKPVEFPLEFFLKQAWNPAAMTPDALLRYPADWAARTFGARQSAQIGDLLTRYAQLAASKKPELLDDTTFALGGVSTATLNGGEFGRKIADWDRLEADMQRVRNAIPADHRDAFFQLVEHRVAALANLYRLHYAVAWNRRLASAHDPRANSFADLAEAAFRRDAELTAAYHSMGGGKWDGMMSQVHIGYTTWQQPASQEMPLVRRVPGSTLPVRIASTRPDAVAIEAVDFTSSQAAPGMEWRRIPYLGKWKGAALAIPQGMPATDGAAPMWLDYPVQLTGDGDLVVSVELVPTLDVEGQASQRFGVSIDDSPMKEITIRQLPVAGDVKDAAGRQWTRSVIDNVTAVSSTFSSVGPGMHTIRFWRIDDNVVLSRLVLRRSSQKVEH